MALTLKCVVSTGDAEGAWESAWVLRAAVGSLVPFLPEGRK